MITCTNCGEENPPKFRLCGFCGTPLQAAAPAHEVRKLVSILFCDLKGSTSLGEALDPESLREVMNRYFEVMSAAITRHGGTIEKYIGDAVMAVFGLPRVHEDDALRAVRAAQAMQDGLRELNVELERSYGVTLANRIGVNSGDVVAGDATTNQRLVTGDPVNVAARLEQAAGDTETLIGALTYRLVANAVVVEEVEPLTLKGKAAPVAAYRLVDVRAPNGDRPAAHELVGRAGRAREAACPPRRSDRQAGAADDARAGRGRRRQDAAPRRARRVGVDPCARAPRTLPLVRGGHHLLADRRGAAQRGRHHRWRRRRQRTREAPHLHRCAGRGRRRPRRLDPRAWRDDIPGRRDLLRLPAAARELRA